jgi:hypothetical protein
MTTSPSTLGAAVLATLGLCLAAGQGTAGPADTASPFKKEAGVRRQANDKGETWKRLETPRGIVYVWWPRNYNRREAGIVVYVHGYSTTVDRAWKEHQLAAQFKASRQNALFLVPESPTENAEEVRHPNLKSLLKTVARAGLELPAGHVVLAGHSGGFRSVAAWIDPRVSDIILLDGLYARENVFEAFVGQPGRRLVLVSSDTRDKTVAFCRKLPFAVTRASIPENDSRWSVAERRARLLHLRSQYEHNRMIQNGLVLPLLLKLTSLRRL